MHTYIRTNSNGDTIYVVGHSFTGVWQPLRSFTSELEAAQWVSFLNGGTDPATFFEEVQS